MPPQMLPLRIDISIPIATEANEDIRIFGVPMGHSTTLKKEVKSIKGIGVALVGDRLLAGRFQLHVNEQTIIDTIIQAAAAYSFGCNQMMAKQYPLPEIVVNGDARISASFLPLRVASDGAGIVSFSLKDPMVALSRPEILSDEIISAIAALRASGASEEDANKAGQTLVESAAKEQGMDDVMIANSGMEAIAFLAAVNIVTSSKTALDNDAVSVILHLT